MSSDATKALLALVWRVADGEDVQGEARALLHALPRCACEGCNVILIGRPTYCSQKCGEHAWKARRDGAIHRAATTPLPHYRLEEREHE